MWLANTVQCRIMSHYSLAKVGHGFTHKQMLQQCWSLYLFFQHPLNTPNESLEIILFLKKILFPCLLFILASKPWGHLAEFTEWGLLHPPSPWVTSSPAEAVWTSLASQSTLANSLSCLSLHHECMSPGCITKQTIVSSVQYSYTISCVSLTLGCPQLYMTCFWTSVWLS